MEENAVKQLQKMFKDDLNIDILVEKAEQMIRETNYHESFDLLFSKSNCTYSLEFDAEKVFVRHYSTKHQEEELLALMHGKYGKGTDDVHLTELFDEALFYEYYRDALEIRDELIGLGFEPIDYSGFNDGTKFLDEYVIYLDDINI